MPVTPQRCAAPARRRPWQGLWLEAMILSALLVCAPAASPARADTVSDGVVKMAMVYNFGKFIEWPAVALPADARQFTLCTLGPMESFQQGLAAIESKTVQGRELKIRKLSAGNDLGGCQILFLSDSDPKNLRALLRNAHALSILTVSDAEQFAEAGGVIGLTTEGGRVQFSINLRAAAAANLRISSELLRLARIVTGGERP